MTSILTITHIFIFLGYSEFPGWQPIQILQYPKTTKYNNVGYGWDTSHPITISKKSIILIYHYLHVVYGRRVLVSGQRTWTKPSRRPVLV